ncbi:precorrin-6Y C5,15-methyltransferase (decarboxylating) subunit CbiT [Natroniella sulfidigena]|uniref:precorrin-6Y C5,15-methyltransferase (decarboxylating) subunit CbiT n=1 Tax=Natroniella sulfidigena TaxID=723921 RepID=UPI00200B5656|nr:precorrin-6Y C5,15-methyltransferase (decarboxylating) subunit CbiT [Natroniella sulfidigena]MCK8817368.1 precorrin-6Y C5,15-methyltransferase (decarboxylating) subunit CbiT [Natroniella sulfidigena]
MSSWPYQVPGIPDAEFIRGDLPMTKEEVRAVTISKLRLKEDTVMYDIGAGTGSISIEAALVAKKGQIYAIEREEEGMELIPQNMKQFGVDNIELIHGEAPQALADLPAVDRVLIGGSGGNLDQILEVVTDRLTPQGRVVVNAVTMNTLTAAYQKLEELDYQLDICNLAVTRTREIGNYQMFNGLNPVYIISGEKR